MSRFFQYLVLAFLLGVITICYGQSEDQNENCEFWAQHGECEKNPDYMLVNCVASCNAIADEAEGDAIQSFYDIVEKDLHGNDVYFDQFEGKVVYLVNVASHCGYTQENYATFRKLAKYRKDGLEIVLAPCNAFGAQEPGDAVAIEKFTKSNKFEGLILSKDEVNGKDTRPSFKFLKRESGKSVISWNFDGKFIVDRNGEVHLPSHDVEADIKRLL